MTPHVSWSRTWRVGGWALHTRGVLYLPEKHWPLGALMGMYEYDKPWWKYWGIHGGPDIVYGGRHISLSFPLGLVIVTLLLPPRRPRRKRVPGRAAA